jgi:hypothetical protein
MENWAISSSNGAFMGAKGRLVPAVRLSKGAWIVADPLFTARNASDEG